jgi:hypothetical protein
VLHASLGIQRENSLVFPNVIKCVLKRINQIVNLTKIEGIDFRDWGMNLSEMVLDDVSLLTELLILLVSNILCLKLVPELNFIHRTQDSVKFVLIKIYLGSKSITSFNEDAL